ncbi:MAG: hypothetical protein OEZ01_10805 [Candidatus Heimdallarchaeota archaeon]|nr:hypothetical protein [Candidatus Heimdallarchaeota archaeon]
MPYEYQIDTNNNILFINFSKRLDDKELVEAFNTAYADDTYTPLMDQFINFADVKDFSVTNKGIKALADLGEHFDFLNTQWKTVINAPDDLMFGYGRMYQLLRDGTGEDIHITRLLDAALRVFTISPITYPFKPKKILLSDVITD